MNPPSIAQFLFRDLDPVREKWAEIERYNASILDRLPPGAKDFVSAAWHYDGGDPRCPHDSWISAIQIQPSGSGNRSRDIRLVLLGAFHDRFISFTYMDVTDFSIQGQILERSGRMLDWLYDEVHLCDSGSVEHLIEFEQCVMRIECADFSVSDMLIDSTK